MRGLRKDVASSKDLLKKASSAPITEATSQTDTLRKDLDTLTKRVQSSTELSQLKADFSKVKEEYGKELEQHEEYIGRFERDLQADNTRINEVNQDIGNLNAGLKNLQSKVRKIDFDLADLEDEVGTHLFSANDGDPTKVKLIGGQASARQSESQRVTNTLNSHEKDLKILKSEVLERAGTSTSSDSSTLSNSLDHLQARLEVQQKTIDTTISSVKDLEKSSGDIKAVQKTIHELENKLNSQLSSTKAETDGLKTRLDTLEENQTSLHNKLEDTVSKVNALVKNDNIQKSLDTLKEKQTSLQSKVEKIDAEIGTIDPKSLLKDVATLKSENRSNARSVEELDRILNGSKVATTSKGKAAQENPGLLQQLDELKGKRYLYPATWLVPTNPIIGSNLIRKALWPT
ncbi:Peptidase m23 [Neofusicoccum parvum]|uniref:Peptidase m23 n=1 Tax=Neofusicoccum parvum TaxID=310453 RepID=A0ACB5S2I6_9PEZI|nr:Peptidase m23 [Neofusicoccum parvum]